MALCSRSDILCSLCHANCFRARSHKRGDYVRQPVDEVHPGQRRMGYWVARGRRCKSEQWKYWNRGGMVYIETLHKPTGAHNCAVCPVASSKRGRGTRWRSLGAEAHTPVARRYLLHPKRDMRSPDTTSIHHVHDHRLSQFHHLLHHNISNHPALPPPHLCQ